jgi:hypothetical protein
MQSDSSPTYSLHLEGLRISSLLTRVSMVMCLVSFEMKSKYCHITRR